MSISRRNTLNLIILCLALSLLAGCAFSSVNRPQAAENSGIREHVIDYPPERAFNLVALTAQNMGYRFFKADRKSLSIITMPRELPAGGNADCGTWNGNVLRGAVDTCLFIDVAGLSAGKSRVKAQARYVATFRGRNVYGMVTTQETFRCTSLGDLEEDFLARLKQMARVTKPEAIDQIAGDIKEEGMIPKPPAGAKAEKDPGDPSGLTEEKVHKGTEKGLALKYHIMYLMGIITERDYKALSNSIPE